LHINRAFEVVRCARHTKNWLTITLCYLGLRNFLPSRVHLRNGRSFEFLETSDVATWWQVFYREVYPVEGSDKLIIDAGANIGAFTLYAMERAPTATIVAIEPYPDTFLRLEEAVRSAGGLDRVRLMNTALSSEPGVVRMQAHNIGSQFRCVLDDDSALPARTVPACTLEQIVSGLNRDIDLLKIDIEGSEYRALLGTPREVFAGIRRLVLEFHPSPISNPDSPVNLFEYVGSAGLTRTEVQDHGGGYGLAYFRRTG
jgi:FkbM family methyltransferase